MISVGSAKSLNALRDNKNVRDNKEIINRKLDETLLVNCRLEGEILESKL